MAHEQTFRLVWSDEFDGEEGSPADGGTWRAETGGSGWGNQELQYYTAAGNAALDGKGNLAIVARRADPGLARELYDGCGYTSARLISKDRMSFRYGLVQARIKIPRARGVWPACWLLGQDIGRCGWPQCGEIDLMEHFGTAPATVHGTVHGPGYSGPAGISASRDVGSSLGRDFHIYSVCWEPGKIRWYVNSELYHTVTPADLGGKPWVFDHDFFLLINLAVGGTPSVPPASSDVFPQTMLIDYIRIYAPPRPPADTGPATSRIGESALASAHVRMDVGLPWPRPRRFAVNALALLAVAGAASAVCQQVSEARDRRRFPPPGRLIDVNGRRLHLVEEGTGSPAVVIVPGLGSHVLEFLPIQQRLAADTRVCVYDRPGLGYSDPPARSRRTVEDMACELHQLLCAAGIGPPYLLAGWSMGGIISRRFAVRFPGAVAAMLLVDSAHEDQVPRLNQEDWRRGTACYWKWAAKLRAQPLGLRRLAAAAGFARQLAEVTRRVPPERAGAARAIYLSSHHRRVTVQEILMRARSHGQPPCLGCLPLTVLTAAGRGPAEMKMQAELAAISADSKHITAHKVGHDMHLTEPDLIVQAVQDLIPRSRAAS